ncbi:MAG: hypothetical protein AAGA17_00090 [Actinomycetota bacterium]
MTPIQRLTTIAKAIVAVVTPILSLAITDAVAELSVYADGLVASAATALLVWATPNTSTPEMA